MAVNSKLSLPTPQQAIDQQGNTIADVWWRFFQQLYLRDQTTIPAEVDSTVTAAGTTQATATQLATDWVVVATTPANSGVILEDFGEGYNSLIFNRGANTLKVYPPIGAQIDALGTNNPYSLATVSSRDFYQVSATQFYSR